jgi:ADP-ribose pyrophosphatase YjhB (NUDIX family)
MLPGGGIRKGETAQAAIERKVWEELRLRIVRKEIFGQFVAKQEGKTDNVTLFICHTQGDPKPGNMEILEAKFYPRDNLPANASPATHRRLSEFLEGGPVQQEW